MPEDYFLLALELLGPKELKNLQVRTTPSLDDPKYENMVNQIRNVIRDHPSTLDKHLYTHFYHTETATTCTNKIGLGSFGDSFYEYMLKAYILDKNDSIAKEMYQDTSEALKQHIVTKTRQNNYYVKTVGDSPTKMEHLACFSGGMFALSSFPNVDIFDADADKKKYWHQMGAELTKSCRLTYAKTDSGIGPDGSIFDGVNDGRASNTNSLLRPETVESYFYMYRLTKDEKYRKWAWELAVGLEKYAKANSGYSGLRSVNDVRSSGGNFDGCQQSFFLAETLKYLYLIFNEDEVISLDEFVFNTEAHPLMIIQD